MKEIAAFFIDKERNEAELRYFANEKEAVEAGADSILDINAYIVQRREIHANKRKKERV